VCKVQSPQDDSPRVFELIIDRQEHRVLECFRSPPGIVTQEFSETSIAAECPISEGGKRTFRIIRETGAVTVSEVVTRPLLSKRNYVGKCEAGQIQPSTPSLAEAPSGRIETPKVQSQPEAQQSAVVQAQPTPQLPVKVQEYTAAFSDAAVRYARLSEGPIKATIISRLMMGQALICDVDQERIVRLVQSSKAVIQALGADKDTLDLADDVLKQGASLQRSGTGASCSEVQRVFDLTEQVFRSRGFLSK